MAVHNYRVFGVFDDGIMNKELINICIHGLVFTLTLCVVQRSLAFYISSFNSAPPPPSYIHTHADTAVILNLGDQGDNGTMFKIIPETTKEYVNVKTCVQLPGISVAPVNPQGVLPDMSMYKVRVEINFNGRFF